MWHDSASCSTSPSSERTAWADFSDDDSCREEPESAQEPALQAHNLTVQEMTLVVKNVPEWLAQDDLLHLLEGLYSMRKRIDFFYCPWNPQTSRNKGFALINFYDSRHAAAFRRKLSYVTIGTCLKPMRVVHSAVQGLRANLNFIRRTRSSDHSQFSPLCKDDIARILHRRYMSQETQGTQLLTDDFLSGAELGLLCCLGDNHAKSMADSECRPFCTKASTSSESNWTGAGEDAQCKDPDSLSAEEVKLLVSLGQSMVSRLMTPFPVGKSTTQ
eukprot:TRINITY_DN84385_c0_g1_i1.p1 TRINITY_DN84385_c0_g1~~TRINITY_DN84385_c0_g1_i1.p1  ORF type:complete len:273 (+),score=38.15 TRINITY_DN84385_c0_g1_i1:94-912(+)